MAAEPITILGLLEDTAKPERSAVSLTSIKAIAAGGNHTLILSEDGLVESYGDSSHGQYVSDDLDETRSPEQRQWAYPHRVAQVSATWTSSVLLHHDGTLSTCGEGLSGELGLGVTTTHAPQTCSIPDFPPHGTVVVHIASCMAHTVAVLSNGEVWGWGRGRQGQLGEPAEIVWSPRRVEGLPFPAVKAVCGKDFTCIVGGRGEGRILIVGLKRNDRFNLVSSAPSEVPGWKNVAASWGGIYVLSEDGVLLGFGRNDHGQLPPIGLPPVEAIAAGSEHCLALTKAGKVLAWGWGEHGNCGAPTGSDGGTNGLWTEIEVPRPVKAVFAGCATSFVISKTHHEPDE
ncbi:alpha tubulin suppressor [Teratosphaeriaceae sp. CCFEE 6253]|nr:alpha tubulin suppressor [Teratosphaeriaceae sp. CCFEE 6253]